MAKVRNVSGDARIVPVLGHRTVEVDEVTEVPDELFESFVCQTEIWEPVTEPAKTKKGSK